MTNEISAAAVSDNFFVEEMTKDLLGKIDDLANGVHGYVVQIYSPEDSNRILALSSVNRIKDEVKTLTGLMNDIINGANDTKPAPTRRDVQLIDIEEEECVV